jgi:hypothetical protein
MIARICVLAVSALCIATTSLQAHRTTILKEGGVFVRELDREGFNIVRVERTTTYTNIGCKDPGVLACPDKMIASGPGRPADGHTQAEDAAIDHAHAQIALGVLSGNTQFVLNGNPNVKRLVWSVDSMQQLNGCIRAWTDGDPDPGCPMP